MVTRKMKNTNDSPQVIVEYFFAEAAEHIKTAQHSEIEALSPDKYKHILKIKSRPLDHSGRKQYGDFCTGLLMSEITIVLCTG